jgi:hypothetical protein
MEGFIIPELIQGPHDEGDLSVAAKQFRFKTPELMLGSLFGWTLSKDLELTHFSPRAMTCDRLQGEQMSFSGDLDVCAES